MIADTAKAAALRAFGVQSNAATFSGILVVVCFLPMAFDSTPAVQQLGLLLVLCAFVHTFVVRPTLVPSLLLWWGEDAWWPAYLAPPAEADYVGFGTPSVKVVRRSTPAPAAASPQSQTPDTASLPPVPTRHPIITGPFPGGPPPSKEM